MPEINNWFDAIATLIGCLLYFYLFYLTVKFLKRGIRFFDHIEQDREYKQWQARQSYSEKKENG